MLNATFAFGGPLCLWKTVEQETGIRIDHYVGLTFSGFINVINDIGGVNVCLPKSIHDPKSGLNLRGASITSRDSRHWPSGASGTSARAPTCSGSRASST